MVVVVGAGRADGSTRGGGLPAAAAGRGWSAGACSGRPVPG
ncbi:hypothetical protein AB5J62_24520 [Amycolatopsis sp. cg5]